MIDVQALAGNLHRPANSRLPARPPGTSAPPRPAVFLDRDGVIVEDVHFLRTPDQIRILPGVPEALRLLADAFLLVVVSNQSGLARGYFDEAGLLAIHTELVRRLAAFGAQIDVIYYCPHLPAAAVAAYRQDCFCRKPKAGMIRQAAADWNLDLGRSFLVGDSPRDIEASRAAGVRGILLNQARRPLPGIDRIAPDLGTAATSILQDIMTPADDPASPPPPFLSPSESV